MNRPAIFFDRDGTLNREVGHISNREQIVLLPRARRAVSLARDSGFRVVMITNQSGVARGSTTEAEVIAANQHVSEMCGGLDAVYYCPHHPEVGMERYRRRCRCRKPGAGMIRRAGRELDLALADSWVIGDSARDIAAGQRAGLGTVLVLGGKSSIGEARAMSPPPDGISRDALAAVEWIVRTGRQG